MRRARIGSLQVSVIGLGCNNLGRALDKDQSAAVVGAALDAGINYFDTATNYGEGKSEAFLGSALSGKREQAVIATKFGLPVPGWEGSGGAKPGYVREATERTLRQLGTDYVDLLMLHFPDAKTPIEDTLEAMSLLVDEGKAREIGCSNFDADRLGEALDVATANRMAGFVCNQVQYSLVHREPERDGVAQACVDRGVALLPYYPLASGLLTGKTRRGQPPRGRLRMERYQEFLSESNFDIVERVAAFAETRGLTMVQVALGWLLAQKAVPAVTPGATSPQQVTANAAAADWQPTPEDLAQLEIATIRRA